MKKNKKQQKRKILKIIKRRRGSKQDNTELIAVEDYKVSQSTVTIEEIESLKNK